MPQVVGLVAESLHSPVQTVPLASVIADAKTEAAQREASIGKYMKLWGALIVGENLSSLRGESNFKTFDISIAIAESQPS